MSDEYNRTAQPIRDAINSRPLTDFYPLEKSRKAGHNMYVCPICGSGHGSSGTGALSLVGRGGRWIARCFAGNCFTDKGQDTLGALRTITGKSEKEVFEMCGYHLGDTPPAVRPPQKEAHADRDPRQHDFSQQIKAWAERLPGSAGEQYLIGRGFTKETMVRFMLGFNAANNSITIPYNKQGTLYSERMISPGNGAKYRKPKGIRTQVYNPAALQENAVFIVEGELDAIVLMQCGGNAVALGGAQNHSLLIDRIKEHPTNAAIILCMDNDKPGETSAMQLAEKLEAIGCFVINGTHSIMGDQTDESAADYCKDPNDALNKYGQDRLSETIASVMAEAKHNRDVSLSEKDAERQKVGGAGAVDSFLDAVQTERFKPMPTGITDIDLAIGGGFIRQQLVTLGAAPGVGKTALTQWIFETMAQHGTKTIYLNLEMSREQMIARSLSRICRVPPTKILQGYSWSDDERSAVIQAAQRYKAEVAENLIYNPENCSASLDNIIECCEAEAIREEAAGGHAPCVVIDYLQLVTGRDREDAAEVIKRAVKELKDFAIRHNTIVYAIIATNRASNKTGETKLESGRDTSALEYSADLALGLSYTLCLDRKGQTAKSKDELSDEELKLITLSILKSRFGMAGRYADLYFNGETMMFTQVAKGFTPVATSTPFDKQRRL